MNYVQLIQETVDFIEAHPEHPLSLEDLASRCNLSKFHFSRIFKALTHRSLRDYIIERRMVHAACRLRESSEKIIDIALASGFRSPEVFSRSFHRFSGMSPSVYRRYPHKLDAVFLQKARITERAFKNIDRKFVTACSFTHLDEINIYHRSCRFNPDEAAGLDKATRCTTHFVDAYMTPDGISPLYTVSISENCSASHILYLAGYNSNDARRQRGTRSFSIPAARYAVFHYYEDFGNIYRSAIDDILLSLAAQHLTLRKCDIDFFQRYDTDYREKGFQLYIPIEA